MNEGQTAFSQVMAHGSRFVLDRCIRRYHGNRRVRSLSCRDQYLSMAFAQLTYRASLRDIEACLGAVPDKLYHLGIRGSVARSTLADADEKRDWRIFADFAQRLVVEARRLCIDESLGLEELDRRDQTVYALDATTIDLCLSVFLWARFRSTKAGVEMHTLLDLRGSIPAFTWITEARFSDVRILDALITEPGSIYLFGRGFIDFARLHRLNEARAIFVTRTKRGLNRERVYSRPVDRSTGLICDQTIRLTGTPSAQDYPAHLRRGAFRDAETGKKLDFLTNDFTLLALTVAELYRLRGGRIRGCVESEAMYLSVGYQSTSPGWSPGKGRRLTGKDRQAGTGVSSEAVWDRLEELAREQAQAFVQRILEEEVTEFLGGARSERRAEVDGACGYRNGYGKPRRLPMSSGTLTRRRLRVRDLEERFESRVLPLFARRTKEIGALLPELYLHGLPEGDFELAFRGLLGEGAPLSKASIRRLRQGWNDEFEAWSRRPSGAGKWSTSGPTGCT